MPLTQNQESILKNFIEEKLEDLLQYYILNEEAQKFIFSQLTNLSLGKAISYLAKIEEQIPNWKLDAKDPLLDPRLIVNIKITLGDLFELFRSKGDYCTELSEQHGIQIEDAITKQKIQEIFKNFLQKEYNIEISTHPIQMSLNQAINTKNSPNVNNNSSTADGVTLSSTSAPNNSSAVAGIVSTSTFNDQEHNLSNLMTASHLSADQLLMLKFIADDADSKEAEKVKARLILSRHQQTNATPSSSKPMDKKEVKQLDNTPAHYKTLHLKDVYGMNNIEHDGDIILTGSKSGMGNLTSKYGSIIIHGSISGMGNITAKKDIIIHGSKSGMCNVRSLEGEAICHGTVSGMGTLISSSSKSAPKTSSTKKKPDVSDSSSDSDNDSNTNNNSTVSYPNNSSAFTFFGNTTSIGGAVFRSDVNVGSKFNCDGSCTIIGNKTSISQSSLIDIKQGNFKLYVDNKGQRTVTFKDDKLSGLKHDAAIFCNDIKLSPDSNGRLDLTDFRENSQQISSTLGK